MFLGLFTYATSDVQLLSTGGVTAHIFANNFHCCKVCHRVKQGQMHPIFTQENFVVRYPLQVSAHRGEFCPSSALFPGRFTMAFIRCKCSNTGRTAVLFISDLFFTNAQCSFRCLTGRSAAPFTARNLFDGVLFRSVGLFWFSRVRNAAHFFSEAPPPPPPGNGAEQAALHPALLAVF